MSNMSVGRVRLPRASILGFSQGLARRLFFRALEKIEVGSIAIHDGNDTFHFGTAGNPAQPHAEVQIHNSHTYRQMLTGGSIGAGEAYMRGDWTSPDLTALTRLFSANMDSLDTLESGQSWLVKLGLKIAHTMNRNTADGSRKNIAAHYDLGNEFFHLFLDPTMMYSSAVFTDEYTSLETASREKLEEICRQLELKPEDHLLEIGTGWGGMAIHAARHYGCQVTTTTISQEQFDYACARVLEEGLQDQVTVLCQDYRKLTGRYDKLVSIEMIEAVGHDFYSSYFQCCSALLKPHGKMVIQAITMADQRYAAARDSVDFIKRYIFPGGCLPSVAVIAEHLAEDTDMQLVHLRDITQDYALTLAHWRKRFMAELDAVQRMGFDNSFIRMWEFYLSYCEGGFRERIIGTVQLSFAKPGYRDSGQGA
ncbi:MAG: cyclopropane-fatty-acyl-phospholipid synthase family protein [Halioglobus sp.]